jgi:hypothetical protein
VTVGSADVKVGDVFDAGVVRSLSTEEVEVLVIDSEKEYVDRLEEGCVEEATVDESCVDEICVAVVGSSVEATIPEEGVWTSTMAGFVPLAAIVVVLGAVIVPAPAYATVVVASGAGGV